MDGAARTLPDDAWDTLNALLRVREFSEITGGLGEKPLEAGNDGSGFAAQDGVQAFVPFCDAWLV